VLVAIDSGAVEAGRLQDAKNSATKTALETNRMNFFINLLLESNFYVIPPISEIFSIS
jgi:hypothetical protein